MPFDPESGQMYRETVAWLPRKDEDDWVYVDKPGHLRARPRNRPSTKGTRTFYQMALLSILRNLDLLYPDLLKAFPLPILEKIWTAIKRKKLDGLRVWKAFAPVLGQAMVRNVIKRPCSSFHRAIEQGTSLDCAWLTNLTIDAVPLTMADYVLVSKMPNLNKLAVLAAPRNEMDFSDRVLRAWASDAVRGSFSRLRAVFVSGHEHVTPQCVAYLSSFKVLEIFCAQNCAFDMRNLARHTTEGDFAFKLNPKGKFRSSFQAYMETRDQQQSKVPHLMISVLPEYDSFARSERFSDGSTWHCFERIRVYDPSKQPTIENDTVSSQKRRKLKDGKAKSLNDVLEGLS